MNNYLLELGVEEFPSRFIDSTKRQLLSNVLKGLEESGLSVDSTRIESTPRRFALWLCGIRATDEAGEEILRGPAKRIAFDDAGRPSKALQGFLKSKKAELDDVYFEEQGKETYVFVRIAKQAINIEAALAEVIPQAIRRISNPRSMQWGGKRLHFLRPIRWIVSLYNDGLLPIDLDGIVVSDRTHGHRFLGEKQVKITSIADYERLLEEQFVIIDERKRRDIIVRGLNRLARENGGVPLMDEGLMQEVVHIVEYPTVFMGRIPEDYLSMPKEIIITPMKDHQRYFPVVDEKGNLQPYFISVRNGDERGLENVSRGNERVLVPRLEDAKFFYNQDLEHPLEDYVERLDTLVFHEKLGTIRQKSERLVKLVELLGESISVGENTIANAKRAAHLSKADLVTNMVVEFTELQGVMGRIYADKSGENPIVAQAIEEQYMPISSGNALPESTSGMLLSMADKIDSMAGLFAIGIEVTGSQDPFGMRRSVLGMLDMLLHEDLHLNLEKTFRDALLLYVEQQGLIFDYDEIIGKLMSFVKARLRIRMRDRGVRYDIIDAVLATADSDFVGFVKRAEAIEAQMDRDDADAMMTTFVRIETLAKRADGYDVDETILQPEDLEMFEHLGYRDEIHRHIDANHFDSALEILRAWLPLVNHYMDKTMIMVEDEALKASRLAMLNIIYGCINQILIPGLIVR